MMMKRSALLLACVLSMTTLASHAHALTCATNVRPGRGEPPPRNTRIWIAAVYNDLGMYRIVGQNETEVPFTRSQVHVGQIWVDVLTPREPLPYPGSYRVENCQGRCNELTTFSVSAEVDLVPPPPWMPEEIGADVSKDAWGTTRVTAFSVPAAAIAVFDQDGAALDSPLAPGAHLAGWSGSETLQVGEAPCLFYRLTSDTANLRFGLLDLAGNFSGFGSTLPYQKPKQSHGARPESNRTSESVNPVAADDPADHATQTCALAGPRQCGWLAFVFGLVALRAHLQRRSAQPRALRTKPRNARSAGG